MRELSLTVAVRSFFGYGTEWPRMTLEREVEVAEETTTNVAIAGETGTAGVRVIAGAQDIEGTVVRILQRNGHGFQQMTTLPWVDGRCEATNLLSGNATIHITSPDRETVFTEHSFEVSEGRIEECRLP